MLSLCLIRDEGGERVVQTFVWERKRRGRKSGGLCVVGTAEAREQLKQESVNGPTNHGPHADGYSLSSWVPERSEV